MKVMIHSNAPWCGSGYGQQTDHALTIVKEMGHQAACSASFGLDGNVLNLNGVLTMPGANGNDPYGVTKAPVNGKLWGADVLITLLDAWVFEGQKFADDGQRWVCLAPVDHEPVPRRVMRAFKESWCPAVFSTLAMDLLREEGLDPLYLPHTYDPTVMRPRTDADRRAIREKLHIPPDAFAVGVVAANKGVPSRKNFPAIVEAFAGLLAKHDDAVLCLHTTMDSSVSGINIYQLLEFWGIPEASVRYSDQRVASQTVQHMAALYASFDVLVNPAMGEGFGVPILEAQACGTPAIVGDWTAMSELVTDEGGWAIPKAEALRKWTIHEAFQWDVFPGALLDRLEAAYEERGTKAAERRRLAAAEHASRWSLPNVRPYWQAALEHWAERITAEVQAPAPSVEVLP